MHGQERGEVVVEEPEAIPWHFKLLLGLAALYLGYRALQGVEWLVNQL